MGANAPLHGFFLLCGCSRSDPIPTIPGYKPQGWSPFRVTAVRLGTATAPADTKQAGHPKGASGEGRETTPATHSRWGTRRVPVRHTRSFFCCVDAVEVT